jgi:hypothetical protein
MVTAVKQEDERMSAGTIIKTEVSLSNTSIPNTLLSRTLTRGKHVQEAARSSLCSVSREQKDTLHIGHHIVVRVQHRTEESPKKNSLSKDLLPNPLPSPCDFQWGVPNHRALHLLCKITV